MGNLRSYSTGSDRELHRAVIHRALIIYRILVIQDPSYTQDLGIGFCFNSIPHNLPLCSGTSLQSGHSTGVQILTCYTPASQDLAAQDDFGSASHIFTPHNYSPCDLTAHDLSLPNIAFHNLSPQDLASHNLAPHTHKPGLDNPSTRSVDNQIICGQEPHFVQLGSKDYLCVFKACGRHFTRSSDLKRHHLSIHLEGISVLPEFRGHHIGLRLVWHAFERATKPETLAAIDKQAQGAKVPLVGLLLGSPDFQRR